MESEGKKILIIEDDPDISDIYESWFESDGYSVVKTSNGLHGATELLKEKFMVVIVDLNLPLKNGVDIVTFLRKSEFKNQETPAIIVSGFLKDVGELRELPKVFLLEKPASKVDVYKIIKKEASWSFTLKINFTFYLI